MISLRTLFASSTLFRRTVLLLFSTGERNDRPERKKVPRQARAVPRALDSRVSSVLEIVRGGTSSGKNLRFHRSIMTSSRSGLYLALRDAVSAHLPVHVFFSLPHPSPQATFSLVHANDNRVLPAITLIFPLRIHSFQKMIPLEPRIVYVRRVEKHWSLNLARFVDICRQIVGRILGTHACST